MAMKQRPEVIGSWIDRILTEGRNLSKWELDFTESVDDQFRRRGSISERQEEILERIYAEKTS